MPGLAVSVEFALRHVKHFVILSIKVMVMNNLVAKHAHKYNRPVTMRDKKKDYTRKGKSKYNSKKDKLSH